MLMTRYEPLIFNANFTETSSDGKYVAHRGELTICEGEVADAQGRRKPPTEVLKQAAVLGEGDSLKFLTGSLDTVAQLPDLIARFGADITADTPLLVLFVIDATKEMTVKSTAPDVSDPAVRRHGLERADRRAGAGKSDFRANPAPTKWSPCTRPCVTIKPKFAVVSVGRSRRRQQWR